jgi:hypothetical protein
MLDRDELAQERAGLRRMTREMDDVESRLRRRFKRPGPFAHVIL